jgi:hypothetical protein
MIASALRRSLESTLEPKCRKGVKFQPPLTSTALCRKRIAADAVLDVCRSGEGHRTLQQPNLADVWNRPVR